LEAGSNHARQAPSLSPTPKGVRLTGEGLSRWQINCSTVKLDEQKPNTEALLRVTDVLCKAAATGKALLGD
jgi:hypothetical protein